MVEETYPDDRPPWWKTTLVRGHPNERPPPWWDHPDEWVPWWKRPPRWNTTLMRKTPLLRTLQFHVITNILLCSWPLWWKTLLMKDHSDDWPHSWKTTWMRDHPNERPPWWEANLMKDQRPPWRDHPDERDRPDTHHPEERPPRWKTTLILMKDRSDETPPWWQTPLFKTTFQTFIFPLKEPQTKQGLSLF